MRARVVLPKQLHIGRKPVPGAGEEITRAGFGKPPGALWTSTYETAWEEGWPWWLESEGYDYPWSVRPMPDDGQIGWLLHPRECDVWQIDTAAEASEFLDEFAKNPYPEVTGIGAFDKIPDWEAVIASGIDAVRLTCPYDFEVRLGMGLTFYGWDCESTAWLSWQFDSVEEAELRPLNPRTSWEEEDDDEGEQDSLATEA